MSLPNHVAIIMDGNGRWAKKRGLPRVAGHKRGVDTLRNVITECGERGIPALSVFAFSSENWRRPEDEVSFLMGLFLNALRDEVARLHEHGVRFKVAGDMSALNPDIVKGIRAAEDLTSTNARLDLTVCVNYGGQWDITQAMRKFALQHGPDACAAITPEALEPHLALAHVPHPDLLIRTGGEQRISNFMLWQAAYSELFFSEALWPDFDTPAFESALTHFAGRERRYGKTSEQLVKS